MIAMFEEAYRQGAAGWRDDYNPGLAFQWVDISNVALVCPTDGAARAGFRMEEGGGKVRICKKCGTEI